MSKIHNIIHTIGRPGTEEFDLPKGWGVGHVLFLGATTEDERKVVGAGYKILYVLVPIVDEVRPAGRPGRPPKA
jgi:hypothetical protein